MTKDNPLRFTGRGFDKGELSEDERAEIRERNKHYDEHFLDVDTFLKATGLSGLVNIMKGIKSFATTAGVISAIGGLYVLFKSQGWF